MKYFDVIGGHCDGEVYCMGCIEPEEIDQWEREGKGGPIFADHEFDSLLVCFTCGEVIEEANYLPQAYYPRLQNALLDLAMACEDVWSALRDIDYLDGLNDLEWMNRRLNDIQGTPDVSLSENTDLFWNLRDFAKECANILDHWRRG